MVPFREYAAPAEAATPRRTDGRQCRAARTDGRAAARSATPHAATVRVCASSSHSIDGSVAGDLRSSVRDAFEKHPYSKEERYEESYESQFHRTSRRRHAPPALLGRWSPRRQPPHRRPWSSHGHPPHRWSSDGRPLGQPPQSAPRRQRTFRQQPSRRPPRRAQPFFEPLGWSFVQPSPRPFRKALPGRPALRAGRQPHGGKRDAAP